MLRRCLACTLNIHLLNIHEFLLSPTYSKQQRGIYTEKPKRAVSVYTYLVFTWQLLPTQYNKEERNERTANKETIGTTTFCTAANTGMKRRTIFYFHEINTPIVGATT